MEIITIDGKRTNMQLFELAKKYTIGAMNKRKDVKFNHAGPSAAEAISNLFQMLFSKLVKINHSVRYPDTQYSVNILRELKENGGGIVVDFSSNLIDNVKIVVK